LSLSACGTRIPDASLTPIEPTVVPVEAADFVGVTWAAKDSLVVGLVEDPAATRPVIRPWRVAVDGSRFEPIPMTADPACLVADYYRPQSISASAVAVLEWCSQNDPNLAATRVSLVAIDLATGTRSKLSSLDPGTTGFAWNRERDEGIASVGSGICQGLGWIRDDRVVPIDIEVGSGDSRFALGEDLLRTGTDCDDFGRADAPAWSANGSWIYFLASPPAGSGVRRLDAGWDLYAMDATELQPRRLLGPITYPLAVAASANGSSVAFSGDLAPSGEGVWVVDRETGSPRRLCACQADALAFSSDGESLAAVTSPGDPSGQRRLLVFETWGQ
jgi:hypothetical protein